MPNHQRSRFLHHWYFLEKSGISFFKCGAKLKMAEHYRECQGKGMTVREIASKYGFKGPASISERLSLCSLPEQIHQLLFGHPNRISPNHAYEISKLCKPDELKKLFGDNRGVIVSFHVSQADPALT